MDNKSMLAISENTASVGVLHVSIAITGVLEEDLDTIDGLEVVLDFILCISDLELAHFGFQCGA